MDTCETGFIYKISMQLTVELENLSRTSQQVQSVSAHLAFAVTLAVHSVKNMVFQSIHQS